MQASLFLSLFLVVAAAGSIGEAETISPAFQNDSIDNGGTVIGGDPTGSLQSPGGVFLRDRRATRITVRWHDRTDVETGYRIERADVGQVWTWPGEDLWQEVASTGPQEGFPEIVDEGLIPERHYCYRAFAVDDTTEKRSAVRCAVTHAAQTQPIFRVQLQLHTADLENAGTDDDIEVLLQHRALIVPTGNSTWIDYSRNDFERGDHFAYDLNVRSLRRISDITQIFVEKSGSDDWCVSRIELIVNELTYFDQTFEDLPDDCFWVRAASDGRLVIPFESLRNHPQWGRFDPRVLALLSERTTTPLQTDDDPLPEGSLTTVKLPSQLLGLLHADMLSRVEAIIGDSIATEDAHWQSPASGQDSRVSLKTVDEDTYRIGFGIVGEAPFLPDAQIEASLELDVSAACNDAGDQISYAIAARDLRVNADFLIFWLENNIEDAINEQFSVDAIAQRLPLEGLPEGVRCIGAPVTISGAGDVEVRLLLARFFQDEAPEPLPPVDPSDTENDNNNNAPVTGPVANQ